MGPEKVKELLKRYVQTLRDLNNDPTFDTKQKSGGGSANRIPGITHHRYGYEVEYFYANSKTTILPEFLIIRGQNRVDEIKKWFSAEEMKTIILNIHHIGDIGGKMDRLSPEKPYKKGEIGNPFFRMFHEITEKSED
jgi:hypothetical protein